MLLQKNKKEYYAITKRAHFAESNLYYKDLYDFGEEAHNRNKKEAKKNPELELAKKEKHTQQIGIILERLKSVLK